MDRISTLIVKSSDHRRRLETTLAVFKPTAVTDRILECHHDGDLPALPVAADIITQAAPRPRYRLLIADMDSTMIGQECIDEIADQLGLKSQVAAITETAMRGELDFAQALEQRVALLKGLPVSALETVWQDRIRPNPGADQLIGTLARKGIHTALVSGGFTFFTDRVSQTLGFVEAHANRLEAIDGKLTGRVVPPLFGPGGKRAVLEKIMADRDIAASDVIAIGDGANDLPIIRRAGLGLAYRAKPALRAEADGCLDIGDLSAVLAIMGIAPPEWVDRAEN